MGIETAVCAYVTWWIQFSNIIISFVAHENTYTES
jgi:hypothetical protein